MQKSESVFIIKTFFIWLAGLFIILFFAFKFLPLQKDFLGGGLQNYISNPFFWAWGNFDGEHYVSIARDGYRFGEHAFFPAYPLLINVIGKLLGGSLASFNFAGILISLISFFVGLFGFYKLLKIDFSEKITKFAVIFLILFPTSFYFASVYTESLFFALAVWSFVFAREGKWSHAAILGIFLTATRFVGLIIFPALLIEWYLQNKEKKNLVDIFPPILLTIPVGLLAYMYYLERAIKNMFAFYKELSGFGEQRSSHLITLPQVFYRYIFKILPNLNTSFFPVIFTTVFEFSIGLIYLFISIVSLFKVRLSYSAFVVLGYLIPTFSGSFSSLPRYVLVLFPVYILMAQFLTKRKALLVAFSLVSLILLAISLALFSRGYWIS